MPTRRYVNTLLKDMNILPLIKLSPLYEGPLSGLFRDLYVLLRHYVQFAVNDYNGHQLSEEESRELHCKRLARLQRLALKSYKDKLMLLALSSYGSIDQREELEGHLKHLNDDELVDVCSKLGFRTKYSFPAGTKASREIHLEVLLSAHERIKPFQRALSDMNILPTDTFLYEESLLRNEFYDGSRPLAIPKLNLQYLTIGDFLWRAFILHRCEQFFEIRTYLEEMIKRLQPTRNDADTNVVFRGNTRMALPISKATILEVTPPKVGQELPEIIRAEVTLNVHKLADSVRGEWESLKPDDTIFLLAAEPTEGRRTLTNGHTSLSRQQEHGIQAVRSADVIQILDENGRVVREPVDHVNGYGPRPRLRRLIVNLDRAAFQADMDRKEKGGKDIYEQINVVIRRHRRENNFQKILATIRDLAVSGHFIPTWLEDVFLGFGDPSSATYKNMHNRPQKLNLQDTLQDWKHLVDSFPGLVSR